MDAIDNLLFAAIRSPLISGLPVGGATPTSPIFSDYIPMTFMTVFPTAPVPPGMASANGNFSVADKMTFMSFPDHEVIEKSVHRHWHDVNAATSYSWPGLPVLSDFSVSPNYHLIFAYLTENTRVLQIFERLIEKYLQDETLGIAAPDVFQWILNTENLFFKDTLGISSQVRPRYDANRRNAYFRMFGMDLAFGDIQSGSTGAIPYHKAGAANHQFVPLFERYLSELWQGYINARNTSGPNTSDVNNIVELGLQLQELLYARRGGRPGGAPGVYATRNLSQEEYASVILLSWFTFIISYNSPVVQFLNCQSSTIGERLIKIGNKAGIPAHTKSQALFEMAGAAANILTLLEAGTYLDTPANVQTMLSSLNPPAPGAPFVPSIHSDYMNAFLTVINNWEKATGHRIKNPEANITGTVRIQQPSVRPQPVMN